MALPIQALERVGGLCLNPKAVLEGQEKEGPAFSTLATISAVLERPMVQVAGHFGGHVDSWGLRLTWETMSGRHGVSEE